MTTKENQRQFSSNFNIRSSPCQSIVTNYGVVGSTPDGGLSFHFCPHAYFLRFKCFIDKGENASSTSLRRSYIPFKFLPSEHGTDHECSNGHSLQFDEASAVYGIQVQWDWPRQYIDLMEPFPNMRLHAASTLSEWIWFCED